MQKLPQTRELKALMAYTPFSKLINLGEPSLFFSYLPVLVFWDSTSELPSLIQTKVGLLRICVSIKARIKSSYFAPNNSSLSYLPSGFKLCQGQHLFISSSQSCESDHFDYWRSRLESGYYTFIVWVFIFHQLLKIIQIQIVCMSVE